MGSDRTFTLILQTPLEDGWVDRDRQTEGPRDRTDMDAEPRQLR